MESAPMTPSRCRGIVAHVSQDLAGYHPKTVVLFGSGARYLQHLPTPPPPNDLDLLVVCHNLPWDVLHHDYGLPVQLHRYHTDDIVGVAKSIRYDSRPVALAKLYGRQTVSQDARGVIAACLLLGPQYPEFGIEQIEVNGLPDPRDYSVHEVFYGDAWWRRLKTYARCRRGPIKRFSDRIVNQYEFSG